MLVTNLKILGVVIGTLLVYTLVAMSIPQIESEVPEELSFSSDVTAAELVAAGRTLFEGSGGCTACHGSGTRAPNLRTDHEGEGPIGQRCDDRVAGQDCKEYIYTSLMEPLAYVVPGFDGMVFDGSVYSPEQIWSLVAYVQDMGGEVTVTGADIAASAGDGDTDAPAGGGAQGGPVGAPGGMDPVALLEANLCLGCHTHDGAGVELGPSFDGIGSRLTPDEIRQSILDPNAGAAEGYEQLVGAMPPNFGNVFSAAQLEALVQYLASRR